MKANRILYTVKEKVQETHNVVTLKLSCGDGLPKYCSGQFITVYFDDTGNAEGKAYTISSAPQEGTLNITVKGVGQFSHRLCAMNDGDTIEASLPYGYFYSESSASSLVMIAGGMGVAPFRSMIMDSVKNNHKRNLVLFTSNKKTEDTIFKNEFEKVQNEKPLFAVHNYVTQEDRVPEQITKGRITIEDIIDRTKNLKDKEFLICGSIPFVRDFWKGLKQAGIPEETVYTEAFF
jgi:ferredoxin-NADP reductase